MSTAGDTPTAQLANWADRVRNEVLAACRWETDWHSLYPSIANQMGHNFKIKSLEEELKSIGGQHMRSTSSLSYQHRAQFKEISIPAGGAHSKNLSTADPCEILGSSGSVFRPPKREG
mmetsp:Transcript_15916/g.46780  ORF Transcript_15916/g.46780 Transcript_15916/m.46780 type:complete len:118 (-) Transcript_15916:405-758(-)